MDVIYSDRGRSGPKNCPIPSRVHMVENLFSNPKLLRNHTKSINSSQHPYRGLKFGMIILFKCLQKVIYPIFDILNGCHFIEGNSLRFPLFPFFKEIYLCRNLLINLDQRKIIKKSTKSSFFYLDI